MIKSMKLNAKRLLPCAFLTLTALQLSCAESPTVTSRSNPKLRFQRTVIQPAFKSGELAKRCDQALGQFKSALIGVENAFDLDRVWTDFNDAVEPLTFMGYVSPDAATRTEASACEEKYNKALADVFTHRGLYEKVKKTSVENIDQQRLVNEFKRQFEKNGMNLSPKNLKIFRALREQLAGLEAQFMKNYNADASTVEFSASDLDGVSGDFLARLKKAPASLTPTPPPAATSKAVANATGNDAAISTVNPINDVHYIVTTKWTDVEEVLMEAKNSETREKMLLAYDNRAAELNDPIMAQAVLLREKLARMVGFKNWADYRIKGNMAKNSRNVMKLLDDLKSRLAPKYDRERADLLAAKQQFLDPEATKLNAWDIRYLAYQIQKRDYQLDEDKLSEYFPKDKVVAGMFGVYSTLLGVRFEEVKGANVWAPEVKLYAILNKGDDRLIGYFYTDFVPRPGKYGHAASFPLISGRDLPSGSYAKPVSAIVANFNPPSDGHPALLKYSEVRTLFHEFGHIMHQTLTRAPYGYLSGTNVAQDFVEAPSQMFEKWVLSPMILRKISGYYKDESQPLPDNLIAKIVASENYEHENLPIGYYYLRQLVFALTDMKIHMARGPVDPEQIYANVHDELLKFPTVQGSHFMASFGHLMDGYDAGYYGYLWSEVYAADMFTAFKSEGLLNPAVGARFRSAILEQGDMSDALSLISTFLGRQPNNDAFLASLGL